MRLDFTGRSWDDDLSILQRPATRFDWCKKNAPAADAPDYPNTDLPDIDDTDNGDNLLVKDIQATGQSILLMAHGLICKGETLKGKGDALASIGHAMVQCKEPNAILENSARLLIESINKNTEQISELAQMVGMEAHIAAPSLKKIADALAMTHNTQVQAADPGLVDDPDNNVIATVEAVEDDAPVPAGRKGRQSRRFRLPSDDEYIEIPKMPGGRELLSPPDFTAINKAEPNAKWRNGRKATVSR